MSHLAVDSVSGGPVTDAWHRCSHPAYYAVGNVLGPAKMAVSCWRQGKKAAGRIVEDLSGKLPVHNANFYNGA